MVRLPLEDNFRLRILTASWQPSYVQYLDNQTRFAAGQAIYFVVKMLPNRFNWTRKQHTHCGHGFLCGVGQMLHCWEFYVYVSIAARFCGVLRWIWFVFWFLHEAASLKTNSKTEISKSQKPKRKAIERKGTLRGLFIKRAPKWGQRVKAKTLAGCSIN